MNRLICRHSLSEANNRENYGKPAFGHPDAPLMPDGRKLAKELGEELLREYGIDPAATPVAVSTMRRSRETALEAGFADLREYAVLSEVDAKLPYLALKETIANRKHTDIAINAAKLILENPPAEQVWVAHGLIIAGLCEVLGVAQQFEYFVPKFCEIRELTL